MTVSCQGENGASDMVTTDSLAISMNSTGTRYDLIDFRGLFNVFRFSIYSSVRRTMFVKQPCKTFIKLFATMNNCSIVQLKLLWHT